MGDLDLPKRAEADCRPLFDFRVEDFCFLFFSSSSSSSSSSLSNPAKRLAEVALRIRQSSPIVSFRSGSLEVDVDGDGVEVDVDEMSVFRVFIFRGFFF